MRELDKPIFNARMARLLNMYSHKSFDKNVADYYWQLFQPYTVEQFLKAIDKHVMKQGNGAFFPKPCDILEHIENADDEPLSAWLLVEKASKCNLWKYNITFNDKVTHFVIDSLGGFYKMFHPDSQILSDKERPFLQAEFIKRYKLSAKNILPNIDMVIYGDNSTIFIFDLSNNGFNEIENYLFGIKLRNFKKMQEALLALEAREVPTNNFEYWKFIDEKTYLEDSINSLKTQIESTKKPLKLVSGL